MQTSIPFHSLQENHTGTGKIPMTEELRNPEDVDPAQNCLSR
jgi:hypothetical protein